MVIPSGNATGVEVPDDVMRALGPRGRPPVMITINTHTWRSRTAAMRGQRLIGISAAHLAATRISEGDIIEVDVEIDDAPRVVLESADLSDALNNCPEARTSCDSCRLGSGKSMSTRSKKPRVEGFASAASAN